MAIPRISFVSLGCPKALVDSERIITRLRSEGYEISHKHQGDDLVIMNTCGFLDSARGESLANIDKALKENGKVIVTGCLGADPDMSFDKHILMCWPLQDHKPMKVLYKLFIRPFLQFMILLLIWFPRKVFA